MGSQIKSFLTNPSNEVFWFASFEKEKLDEIRKSLQFTEVKTYITLMDVDSLLDKDCINVIYSFNLLEYLNSRVSVDFSNEFYEKFAMAINLFKLGFKQNKLNFYFSYYIMSSILEELLVRIARKEKINLNSGFSIGSHISTLKGKSYLILAHMNKVKEEGGKKYLQIFSEESNTKNVFITNKNKDEGNRILNLLDEFEQIRTKYVHYTSQEANNPSDCLIGMINLGQFLIWCEENEYI